MLTKPALKKTRAKVSWVKVRDLVVDHTYQRPLNQTQVNRIVTNFDPDLIGVPTVSLRDGTHYVVDGQHRRAALMEMGYADQKIQVEILEGLAPAAEAGLFVGRNESVKVQAIPRFIARVKQGELQATEINKALTTFGYTVGFDSHDGAISCVQALDNIYEGKVIRRINGSAHLPELRKTLATISAAWGTKRAGVQSHIVSALGALFMHYGDEIDTERLVKILAKYPGGPDGLIGDGKTMRGVTGGRLHDGIAGVLVNHYNRGLRQNQLDAWR